MSLKCSSRKTDHLNAAALSQTTQASGISTSPMKG